MRDESTEARIPEDAWRNQPTRPPFPRRYTSAALGVFGAVIGAVAIGYGYIFVVGALEVTLAPPLEPLGNYGQFGFVILVSMPCGFLCGASFALLPCIRFRYWLPGFAAFGVGVSTFCGRPGDVLHAAAMLLCVLVALAAFIISRRVGAAERSYASMSE